MVRKYYARGVVGKQMKSQEMLGGFLEEMLRALRVTWSVNYCPNNKESEKWQSWYRTSVWVSVSMLEQKSGWLGPESVQSALQSTKGDSQGCGGETRLAECSASARCLSGSHPRGDGSKFSSHAPALTHWFDINKIFSL